MKIAQLSATVALCAAVPAMASTNVVIVGVENLEADSFSSSFKSSKGGFGRMIQNGILVEEVPLTTWNTFFQPNDATKPFFDVVNDRIVEMKMYHLIISDKFAQDFSSAAFHSWPRMHTILEKGESVECPPYTTRSWSPPCTALQQIDLVHSCVTYDDETFSITGDGSCPTDSFPIADELTDEDDDCATCQHEADTKVVDAVIESLENDSAGNIIFAYLQAQELSSINKSLHSLIAAIDNAEDNAEIWSKFSLIVTGATHTRSSSDAKTPWLAYGAGLRRDVGGVVLDSTAVAADVTLATTLKLLGLDSTGYSKPSADLFYVAPKGESTSSSLSSSDTASSGSSSKKNCQQHNGLLGSCPTELESWFYKEFPDHVALFSFVGGIILSFGLIFLSCTGYIVARAAILGSKKVRGCASRLLFVGGCSYSFTLPAAEPSCLEPHRIVAYATGAWLSNCWS
eukprot:INCI10018.1.p1 GENE.INCI10018.1~~INCI10018.1.p1  ORF type:complete len:457 (+),score=67.37 INCI10018.1:231-1601(+)